MLQIAINNSIGGGTGLPGSGGGGGVFANKYSLDFDGVDDFVSTNSKIIASDITLSGWVNFNGSYSAFSAHFPMSITPSNTGVPNETLGRFYKDGSTLQIAIQCNDNTGGNFSTYHVDNTTLEGAGWQHICLTYNVTTKHIYAYLNGVAQNWIKTFAASTPVPFLTAVTGRVYESDLTIGRLNPTTSTGSFLGLVDEVSTYDKILTQAEITSIASAPTDLTDLSPIAWYRNGDNGSWKSPQWLIPNNENKDKVSNYSFEFDGIDDYVSIPNNVDLNFTSAYSVSCWIKTTSAALLSPVSNQSKFLIRLYGAANQIRVQLRDGSNGLVNLDNTQVFNDGNWHHIAFTTEATTTSDKVIVYFDGVALTNKGTQPNVGSRTSAFAYDIGRNSGTWNFNGNIDEVSLYDSELSASEINDIYNGGEPTTISGAVAHYKMGEDATFIEGNWTVPDNAGSNTGTSANMTIEDRVGEAPNSTSNAVSFNMDEVDRVEDVP